ncbi:MAG: hypothetical protein Q7K26_00525 [bacterium]|nr:hypothetical protein [bacterium]
MKEKMSAKDIPEVAVLQFLESLNGAPATWFDNEGGLFANSIQHGMPAGIPPKIALAKIAAMIRKKLVDGCACGCRGDFIIAVKGRVVLVSTGANTSD